MLLTATFDGRKMTGAQYFSQMGSHSTSAATRNGLRYRRTNQHYNAEMIVQTTNRGYGQVMVWGGIIGDRKTELFKS